MLVVVFFSVLCYSILTSLFGEKGFYAQEALKAQVSTMEAHVAALQEQEISLSNKVLNLSYDYDTIKTRAHELGFINDGEFMIKLTNYNKNENHNLDPGQYIVPEEITFISDRLIKTISASVGMLVVLIQMMIAYRHRGAYAYKD